MLKICDEPESPHEKACLRSMIKLDRQMKGGCLRNMMNRSRCMRSVFKIHYELKFPNTLAQNNTLQVGTCNSLTAQKHANCNSPIA